MLVDLPPFAEELFFVGPIGAEDSPGRARNDAVFEAIAVDVADRLGLTAVRADHIAQPGDITEQIIDHVLQAAAVLVDLTGRNANVYYELALRHFTGKPVVLISEDRDLPFDLRQLRAVFFSSTDLRSGKRCVAEVVAQMKAAMNGGGYSPVRAALQRAMLDAGGPIERRLTQIFEALQALSVRLPNPAAAKRFGTVLKQARQDAGLSMGDLSDRSGIPRDRLQRIENGEVEPTSVTIVRLADALGVDPADLVDAVDVAGRFGE